MRNPRAWFLTLCCGLSGAASLIHELVWTRRLELLLGTSMHTAAAVLAITMGGMALGASWAGRQDDRAPEGARAYARNELLLSLYCLLMPFLQSGLDPVFMALHQGAGAWAPGLRTLLAMTLVLPGAMLMGATFPPAAGDLIRSMPEDPTGALGRLYGANTFGAFVGVLAGGLLLRPALGTEGTLFVASALSGLAGVLAWQLGPLEVPSRAQTCRSTPPPSPPPLRNRAMGVVLGVYALSGFTALAYEVLLHRLASLWIGGSTYAFAMVLAVFLLGLALGSSLVTQATFSKRSPFSHLALLQGGIAFWVLGLASVAGQIPLLLVRAGLDHQSFHWMLALQFLCILLLLLPGTLCLGATLPTAAACLDLDGNGASGLVGRLYAVNSVGCVLGSLLAGHLLLPAFGLRGALLLVASFNLLAAVIAGLQAHSPTKVILLGANLGSCFLAVPAWNAAVVSSGPFLHADSYRQAHQDGKSLEEAMQDCGEVLFQRDGGYATTTVRRTPSGDLSLQVNGKTDASNSGDLFTQRLLAHLPLLLHPRPEEVLVIGLGSGITAGEALNHPIQHMDVIEIAPEVVEASRYFDSLSGAPLDDPRTRLRVEDARAWIQWTDARYDVISSEPSNPWLAGVANLFTREFFQKCRERLKPEGIMVQWLQAYSTSPEDFRSIVATFSTAFPRSSLWKSTNQTDFLLVGSTGARNPDGEMAVDRILAENPLGHRLREIGLTDRRLALSFVTDTQGVAALARGRPLVTDDDPFLEFTGPRNLYRDLTTAVYQTAMATHHPSALNRALLNSTVLESHLNRAAKAQSLRDQALTMVDQGRTGEAMALLEKSLLALPDDPVTRFTLNHIFLEGGRKLWRQGALREALAIFDHQLELMPEEFEARHLRALCLTRLSEKDGRKGLQKDSAEKLARARSDLEIVLQQTPHDRIARRNLSEVLYRAGDLSGALGAFLETLAGTSPSSRDWKNLASLYRHLGHFPKAARAWRKSLELDPEQPEIRELLDLYLEAAGEEGIAKSLEGLE